MSAIRTMWNEGKTAREIAETVGDTTENAVIGKLNKMGLIGFRRGDRVSWNAAARREAAPTPPRSFSWEQRA